MKKNIFLVICVIAFLFSCSDMVVEEEPGDNRGKKGRNGKDDDGRGDSAKNECKGKGYTIYTYGDCPEGQKGDSSRSSSDSSVLSSAAPVDILFILDLSNSMWYYLNIGFKKRFKNFIPTINQLNWRMFFTNAGYTGGGFWSFFSSSRNGASMPLEGRWDILRDRHYLDRTVKHYQDVFRYTMTRDPDRSLHDEHNQNNECMYPPYCNGTEQPLRALLHSFSANKHLTRKEAAFVAVIISNTDENPESGKSPVTAKEIREEFEKVYGSDKRLIVMNLVVLPGDEDCKKYNDKMQWIIQETNYAKQITEIPTSRSMEGGNYSICLKDYSVVAKGIVHLAKQ